MNFNDTHTIEITINNCNLIGNFILSINEGKKSFRYFEKRPIEIVGNHIITLLICDIDTNEGVVYGHLDTDDDGKIWLGIAVADNYIGQGFGRKMIAKLLEKAKEKDLKEIWLSVDKNNITAKNLYESVGFANMYDRNEILFYKVVI
jgi:GNAT superfamily N-acetyltransferase